MFVSRQNTIAREFDVTGIGLHSGRPVTVRAFPSNPGKGITIARAGSAPTRISVDRITKSQLCTRVITLGGPVDTIEHFLAALSICGIDNIHVEISAGEMPILDGSALPWAKAISAAGIVVSDAFRHPLIVTKPFEFTTQESRFSVQPGAPWMSVTIDYPGTPIGRQEIALPWTDSPRLLAARTFALASEVAALRRAGLGRGGSLANAVVVGDSGPINTGGLRGQDEYVRHKALDLIGDLYVVGAPIIGRIQAYRPGHAANHAFLRAMIRASVLRRVVPSTETRAA